MFLLKMLSQGFISINVDVCLEIPDKFLITKVKERLEWRIIFVDR